MARAVLDASALLALIHEEPGADVVRAALPGALVSAVNLSEVVTKLTERGYQDEEIEETLADLDIEVRPFDAGAARRAGLLRRQTRQLGLSLGDRACIELAQQTALPALTADGPWLQLKIGVKVQSIR